MLFLCFVFLLYYYIIIFCLARKALNSILFQESFVLILISNAYQFDSGILFFLKAVFLVTA